MGIYEYKPEDAWNFSRHVGIEARRNGSELVFLRCPYCKGTSREKEKFSINLNTGQFHCFRASCGAHGNMITLSKDFDFSLGNNVDSYYRKTKHYKILPQRKPEPKAAAIEYMQGRGISEEITNRYNLTVQKEHKNILVFPFYDESGIMQTVKYRKMDFDKAKDTNKEWFEKDCKPILFGMDHCNMEHDTLVLTEGQIDALSLAEAGIDNVVSVPTGANGFTWVPHCWDFLKKFHTLIVFGDCENGTITLLNEMQKRFEGTVKHIRIEDYQGCKDANEILLKFGKGALVNAVDQAVRVDHSQIISLADISRVDMSEMEKFLSGLPSLDRILGGFYFGQLIVVTGERGEGKSTLVSQFGTFAVKADYKLFVYSGELPGTQLKSWFDCQIAGIEHINKRETGSGFTIYSIDANISPLMDRWYRDRIYVYDNNRTEEGESLLKVMEIAIKQYDCRVLVVDNLMTAISDDVSLDQYRQQSAFVKNLANMAKQHDVVIFLVAHPRKNNKYSEFGNDDISGSSDITNLADVVVRYARPKGIEADLMDRELTILKNRTTGVTTKKGIPLFFQEGSRRIAEGKNEDDFNWEIGWERHYEQMEFIPESETDLPF